MMKIRVVINTLAGGGAEKVLINFLRLVPADKYDITVVELYADRDIYQLPAFVKRKVIINSSKKKQWQKKIMLKYGHILSNIILQGDYDVDIAFLEGFPTKILAHAKTHSHKIAFVHCDVSKTNVMGKLYSSSSECLSDYRSFEKVCFVSEGAKEGFIKSVGNLPQFEVVHNCIDTQEIMNMAEQPIKEVYQTDGLKIVAVGRLSEPKCFQRLINIACALEKKYKFEIVIVGEGEKRKELEDTIERKNVKSVRLFGFTDNPYTIMKQADLFVCSSIFEGYSTVTIEALVLGLPVITTCCAGMNEILQNGKYGLIVENDEKALLLALQEIMEFPEKINILKEKAMDGACYYKSLEPTREYINLLDGLYAQKGGGKSNEE